jgi:hypothetical protein
LNKKSEESFSTFPASVPRAVFEMWNSAKFDNLAYRCV